MLGAAPEESSEPPGYTDYATVYIAADTVQAHVVASVLRSEEIEVYLKGEVLSSAIGELPMTVKQVEVQVPTEDRERARGLVMRFESAEP